MGLFEMLTIIFVVLKLVGVINWGWFQVFLPQFIGLGVYIAWFTFVAVFAYRIKK